MILRDRDIRRHSARLSSSRHTFTAARMIKFLLQFWTASSVSTSRPMDVSGPARSI
jgi:hypothetical protein